MVRDCRRRWRLGGLAGLEDALRPGRPKRADSHYVRLLVQTAQKDPRQVGYAFSRWTAPRLAEYLRQETGIVLSAYWEGELLRMHGFVWRRAKRTTQNLVNEGEKERARRRLRALERAACRPRADFELWYGDGVRFDLLPVVRQMWPKKGQRLLVETPGKNERVAVCGAYRFPDGPFLFSHQPRSVNSLLFVALVRKLKARAQATGKRIVLVLDNDGAFTSKLSTQALQAAQAWVRPFWLPKYTSKKLNRVEGL